MPNLIKLIFLVALTVCLIEATSYPKKPNKKLLQELSLSLEPPVIEEEVRIQAKTVTKTQVKSIVGGSKVCKEGYVLNIKNECKRSLE